MYTYVPFRQCPGCTHAGHYRPYHAMHILLSAHSIGVPRLRMCDSAFLNSLFNISVTKRLNGVSYENGLIVYSCRSDYGYRCWPISILLSIFERQRRLELALMLLWGGRTLSPPPPPPQTSVCPTVSLCSLPSLSFGILFLVPHMTASIVRTEHRTILPDGYCSLWMFWVVWYLYVPNGTCMCLMVPVCA